MPNHNNFIEDQPGLEAYVQPPQDHGLEVVQPSFQNDYPSHSNVPSSTLPSSYNTEAYQGVYKPAHVNPLDMEGQPVMGPMSENTQMGEKFTKDRRRICGIKRWAFFTIAIIIALVIIGAVLGGVLGTQLKHNTSSSSPSNATASSTTTATSSPLALAAVNGDSDNVITSIHQDAATDDLYISAYNGNAWQNPIKISGIDPKPMTNSPLATLQVPDTDYIRVFYLADNLTMFDAYGFANSSSWQNGQLAPQTQYRILAANGTGIAATPWMEYSQTKQYSLRVYYVDFSSVTVRELALDPGSTWLQTQQLFGGAISSSSSVSLTWTPAASFSNTSAQLINLFYQDARGNVVHYPSVNGNWNDDNIENIANIPVGTDLSATAWRDTARTLYLFWIDSEGILTTTHGQQATTGTFNTSTEILGVVKAQIPMGPLSAISWDSNIRVYFESATNPQTVTEVGYSGGNWQTDGTVTPSTR